VVEGLMNVDRINLGGWPTDCMDRRFEVLEWYICKVYKRMERWLHHC
jgi:hypothetical protein